MLPLPVALRISGCSRSKYNKLKASGHFNAPIPEGKPGVSTMISEEDALDIAFITVLTRRGFSPEDAKFKSAEWVRRIRDGRGIDPYQVFVGEGLQVPTQASGLQSAIQHQVDKADFPSGDVYRAATDVVVINVGEIQARLRAWGDFLRSQLED